MKCVPLISALTCLFGVFAFYLSYGAPAGVSRLGLVVSEIMYQPMAPSDEEVAAGYDSADLFEFVEITNISLSALDLDAVSLAGAVQFEKGNARGAMLEPGEVGVLVSNRPAFELRFPDPINIIGEFSGNLPDIGGTLNVQMDDAPSLAVSYGTGDRWPKTPGGMGFSLVLMNTGENPDHNVPIHWRASAWTGGSPGSEDPQPERLPIYINEILPKERILDSYYRVTSYPFKPDEAPTGFINTFVDDMQADPYRLCFVHLVGPDLSGHTYDWGSPQQDDAIRAVDVELGEIFKLVDSDPRLEGKTGIILTADHGGGGGLSYTHIDNTYPINYTVHFHVWGPGIPPGADLYELNSDTRTRPHN